MKIGDYTSTHSLPIIASAFLIALISLPAAPQQTVTSPRADGGQTPLRIFAPTPDRLARLSLSSRPARAAARTATPTSPRDCAIAATSSFVMGHKESGPGTLGKDIRHEGIHGGLKDMVTGPTLQRDRMLDLTAALAWTEKQCHHPYKVLFGHSMGSDTVVFEAGARNKQDVHGEDRFDAYVAISRSGPGSIFSTGSWSGIRKPLYVLTGTRDKGLEGDWQWRTSPYDGLPPGCKWLGVIDGATHLNFADIGFLAKRRSSHGRASLRSSMRPQRSVCAAAGTARNHAQEQIEKKTNIRPNDAPAAKQHFRSPARRCWVWRLFEPHRDRANRVNGPPSNSIRRPQPRSSPRSQPRQRAA
jgi:hypothetical protein